MSDKKEPKTKKKPKTGKLRRFLNTAFAGLAAEEFVEEALAKIIYHEFVKSENDPDSEIMEQVLHVATLRFRVKSGAYPPILVARHEITTVALKALKDHMKKCLLREEKRERDILAAQNADYAKKVLSKTPKEDIQKLPPSTCLSVKKPTKKPLTEEKP